MFSDTKLLNYFIAHPSFQIYFWGLYIFEYDSYRCNCTNFDKTLKRFSCFFSHKALISPEWFCREAGFCIFAYFNFSFIPHCEFWCIYLLCRNILPQIYNAVNIFFKKIKRTFQKPPKDFLLGRLFTVKYLLLQDYDLDLYGWQGYDKDSEYTTSIGGTVVSDTEEAAVILLGTNGTAKVYDVYWNNRDYHARLVSNAPTEQVLSLVNAVKLETYEYDEIV